eukprot:gnl/MRDRNA2_/MRDRNA2_19406_c0_seq1.p1 gnl/MRDRNA2_/MRDRNA2_19406_c0~~gnl/MRDRNA2_/MRDRNA2_19406_c0_seq1.p1  ORF type:complete len:373 (+),score=65.56 gnl/MRDRNA2_/MRDRNA2_19406_c0_seq1:82-1200(+)
MGACASSSNAKAEKTQRIVVPTDMESLPLDQRALAAKDLFLQISKQKILFKFRSSSIVPSGQQTICDVATALAALPEVSLRVEGHSNYVAKVANRQTPQDQERMVQLSEDRANSVKSALYAKGVRNQIDCVGLGCQQREPVGCVKLIVVPAVGSSNPVEVGSPVKLASKREGVKEFPLEQVSQYATAISMYKEAPPTPAPLQPHTSSAANLHDMAQSEGSMQVNENFITCRSVYDEWDARAGMPIKVLSPRGKESNMQQDDNVVVEVEQPQMSRQMSRQYAVSTEPLLSPKPASPHYPCPTQMKSSSFVEATKIPKDPDHDEIAAVHQAAFIQVHSGQVDLDSSARNPLSMFCCSEKPRTKGCPGFNSQICS